MPHPAKGNESYLHEQFFLSYHAEIRIIIKYSPCRESLNEQHAVSILPQEIPEQGFSMKRNKLNLQSQVAQCHSAWLTSRNKNQLFFVEILNETSMCYWNMRWFSTEHFGKENSLVVTCSSSLRSPFKLMELVRLVRVKSLATSLCVTHLQSPSQLAHNPYEIFTILAHNPHERQWPKIFR